MPVLWRRQRDYFHSGDDRGPALLICHAQDVSLNGINRVRSIKPMNYEISPREVKELQASSKELTVLDVREFWERETATISPSEHIPMTEIPARVRELDPEQHIVVYCHHGVRSLSVTDWLRKQGFEKVQSMAGGIDKWSVEIDPKVARY